MKIVNSMNEFGSFSLYDRDLCVSSSVSHTHYRLNDPFILELRAFTDEFFTSALLLPSQFNGVGMKRYCLERFWMHDVHFSDYSLSMDVGKAMVYYKTSKPDMCHTVTDGLTSAMLYHFQDAFNLEVCKMLSSTHEDDYSIVHKVDFI